MFAKSRGIARGFSYRCKSCDKNYKLEYASKNSIKIKESNKKYRENHKEDIKIWKKEYYLTNKERLSSKAKQNYLRNRQNIINRVEQYLSENRDAINEKRRNRIKTEEMKRQKREWALKEYKLKYGKDNEYTIKAKLRARMRTALSKKYKSGSAVLELGCTIKELIKYLEGKFKDDMSWENYGKWHIDHIKPLSSFDLTNENEFKEAVNFKNLQPLWAEDNLRKSNKII